MTKFRKINKTLVDEKTKDGSRLLCYIHGNKHYRFVSNLWFESYEGELNYQVFMSVKTKREVFPINNFDLSDYICDYLSLDLNDDLDLDLKNKLIKLESEIKKNTKDLNIVFNRIEFSCYFDYRLNCWAFDIIMVDWASNDECKLYLRTRGCSDNFKYFLSVYDKKCNIIDTEIYI